MKTISVEDDVYDHILRSACYIGEDGSSILRRLIGISSGGKGTVRTNGSSVTFNSPLDECLASPRVATEREAVGRFLAILSWLNEKKPSEFEKVLMIRGRKRKYFGQSEAELNESGNSVNPQNIPGSKYWVITNNDTPKKARMLADVLEILGYKAHDVAAIARVLG